MEAIATVNYLLHAGPCAVSRQPWMRTDHATLSPPHSSGCSPWCGYGGWSACFTHYFTPTMHRQGCLSTTLPLYLDTEGIHINNGNFLPGALTQLNSSKQGKFGGKSEGIIPQRDAAKAHPGGNTSSCFPRDIQLFSTAKSSQHDYPPLTSPVQCILGTHASHHTHRRKTNLHGNGVLGLCFPKYA